MKTYKFCPNCKENKNIREDSFSSSPGAIRFQCLNCGFEDKIRHIQERFLSIARKEDKLND